MHKINVCLFVMVFLGYSLAAQPLPRRGWMDAKTVEINDSLKQLTGATQGLYVVAVGDKGTGASLKLQPGDVLLDINTRMVETTRDLKMLMAGMREGDGIEVKVLRKKKTRMLSGLVMPLPRENAESYQVLYDRVPYDDGFLSMMINKPPGEGPFPVVLFIPGYMCYSLDNIGAHPYGQIVSQLTDEGYMVVRVEKSDQGASLNTPDCRSIGYWQEVRGFAAGLEKIFTLPDADTQNVFIFGHSLGAIQAPFVAEGFPVKGIMVEGTSTDTWFEYILDMFRFQNPLMGSDPAENEAMIARSIPLLYRFLVLGEDPATLALTPGYDSLLTEMLQYDGDGHIWDRHYTYWQELQKANQTEAWRNTNAKVLVMRGSGDLEAFSNEQHELIVRHINHYRPGTAHFVLIPNSDHAFCKSNTPEESFANGQIKGYHYTQFNDEVIRIVHQWMQEVMK